MRQVLYQPEEPLNVSVIAGRSPLTNTSHLVRVGVKSVLVDSMTQAVHYLRIKVAFRRFKVEVVLAQGLENESEVLLVVLDGVGEDEDII